MTHKEQSPRAYKLTVDSWRITRYICCVETKQTRQGANMPKQTAEERIIQALRPLTFEEIERANTPKAPRQTTRQRQLADRKARYGWTDPDTGESHQPIGEGFGR